MTKSLWFCILILQVLSAQDFSFSLPDSAYGWKKSGTTDVYAGEELFRLIDGGADIFFEYGFKKVIVQRYADRNNNFVDVEIYEMNDSSSAYGIFSLFTFTTGKRTDSLAEAFTGDQFLLFRKGNYYVSLTGLNSLKETQEGLFLIAKTIDANITTAGKPKLVTMFEQLKSSKTIYLKGNLGLYNVSKINFGKDFKVETGIYFEKADVTVFVFQYNGENECLRNYSTITKIFKNNSAWKLVRTRRCIVLTLSNNDDGLEKISEECVAILNKNFEVTK